MRIGFDAGKAVRPRDGIGRYARELLRALLALDERPELELFALPAELDEPRVRSLLGELPGDVGLHRGWPTDDPVDVFHATTWAVPPGGPRGFSGPLVFTCYDLTFLSHPECHTLDNRLSCLAGLLRAQLADASFIAISEATADELRRHLGVTDDRLHVIYPAPASGLRPLERADARRRLGDRFGVAGKPVVAVGTLEPRKNLGRLLEAWAGLDEALRRAHPLLLAGGGGWKNDALLERAGELEGVRLLGAVDDEDLGVLYSAARVFAYPSLAEGFGLPVLEAMACGAPVLTSNVSALPEVAGGAARLVDPLDVEAIRRALEALLTRRDERHRLRALGRERAARFSWAETARRTLEVYRTLTA